MPDNSFTIKAVDSSCADLVPDIFRSIYGDDFPVQYVYDGSLVLAEIASGHLSAAIALDQNNHAVGYVAIYNNAPNQKLWEGGNLLVVPGCGVDDLGWHLLQYFLLPENQPASGSDGSFTESVCHHYFTQLGCAKSGFSDCALMLDQMSAASFKEHVPQTSRVACLMQFFEQSDPQGICYLPEQYFDFLQGLANHLRPRTLQPGSAPLPAEGVTAYSDSWFSDAGMWRVSVSAVGSDWDAFLNNLLQLASQRNVTSLQVVVSTALPCCGTAVELMRRSGFYLGGLFPRWFGSDGIMMQRVMGKQPDFSGIKLYSSNARELLKYIQADMIQTMQRECL